MTVLTPQDKIALSEMKNSKGYALLKEHLNKIIRQNQKQLENQPFKDLLEVKALQQEISSLKKVFEFVEK